MPTDRTKETPSTNAVFRITIGMSTGKRSRTLGTPPARPMKSARAASSVRNVLARARMVDVGRTNRGKKTLVSRPALSTRAPRPNEVPVDRKPHGMIPHAIHNAKLWRPEFVPIGGVARTSIPKTSEYTAMFASGFRRDHSRPRTVFLYWPLTSRSVRFTRRFSVGFLVSDSRNDIVLARSDALSLIHISEPTRRTPIS